MLLKKAKPATHLFAGHEQLLPSWGSWYSSSSWTSGLHLGSSMALHKLRQLTFVVPLRNWHSHLDLQSSVMKDWEMSSVLLPYSHFSKIVIIKKSKLKLRDTNKHTHSSIKKNCLREKVSKYRGFFWSEFAVFSPSMGNYEPKKNLCLVTFHSVEHELAH